MPRIVFAMTRINLNTMIRRQNGLGFEKIQLAHNRPRDRLTAGSVRLGIGPNENVQNSLSLKYPLVLAIDVLRYILFRTRPTVVPRLSKHSSY